MEARIRESWPAGEVVRELPDTIDAQLVVLVSGESPGEFAARLGELAASPKMAGKLLAAWSLAGPVREDVPAALLRRGQLAGVGLAEATVVGLRRAVEELEAFGRAVQQGSQARVEELTGPFLWYF